jgi:hypothetical protein
MAGANPRAVMRSSLITLPGLTNGDSYTFTVRAEGLRVD